MNLLQKLRKRSHNDEGSALVLVIIAVAFVGTLVAMLVYLVYFNYLMKFTDRAAKNNFYTAETALDIIHAGLEKEVSDAMMNAYYTVMQNNIDDSATNKQAEFENQFKAELTGSAGLNFKTGNFGAVGVTQSMTYYDPDVLKGFWTSNVDPALSDFKVKGTGTPALTYGAEMLTPKADNGAGLINSAVNDPTIMRESGPLVIYDGASIELLNVRVQYINEDGYVSIMETDVQVDTPKINFANVLNMPQLESYSLVAGGGIYDGYTLALDTESGEYKPMPNNHGADTEVTGNVFGGEDGIYVDGVGSQISFVQKSGDPDSLVRYLTAETIEASNSRTSNDDSARRPANKASIEVEKVYQVYAGDLVADSATMNIATDCYVSDDLTTDGKYPKVVIGNSSGSAYHGYGTADRIAEGSSAILVNGAHSWIDLSNVTNLELADHAYVGAIHYNANSDKGDVTGDYREDIDKYLEGLANASEEDKAKQIESNSRDVMLGQSVAVKADQLMYMVPPECMVYDGSTQLLAKNPMTYAEYKKYAEAFEPETNTDGTPKLDSNGNIIYSDRHRYTMVNLDVLMKSTETSLNSYGAKEFPVFRRINGDILVYYYIMFESSERANMFFNDYYAKNPESFERYFTSYVDRFILNSDVIASGSDRLSLGGNMLYKSGANFIKRTDTLDAELAADRYDAIIAQRDVYSSRFTGLTKYLMADPGELSASQLGSTAFTNLTVNESDYARIVPVGKFKKFYNDVGDVVAIIVNNKGYEPFEFGAANDKLDPADLTTCNLIVATGDVSVGVSEFNGLIFAGGNIYIESTNTKINYDITNVPKAMMGKNPYNDPNGHYAFEVINNGIAYANTTGTTDPALLAAIKAQRESDIIKASDLVRFVNWNKE